MKTQKIINQLSIAILFSIISCTAIAECEVNENGYLNISGEYICTIFCQPNEFMNTYIVQNAGKLTLIAATVPTSTSSIGTISLNKVKATGWGLTATVANNCQELIWNNSTVWLRKK